jgi:hypothetical protein
MTVIVISSLSVRYPPLTSKWTLGYTPACPEVGVQLKTRVVALKVAPEGRLLAEYVRVCAGMSESEAVTVNCKRFPVETVLGPMGFSTGGWLTSFTVTVITS